MHSATGKRSRRSRSDAPGATARLSSPIADDGIGIPLDKKEKIFGKGYGSHTGFGLFLSRDILAITGLAIHETGIDGKGARFEISGPVSACRNFPET